MAPSHTDDGEKNSHPAADLEAIVVDPKDVIKMMRRNNRDQDQQRTHSLRVSPPLEGERKAGLHTMQRGNYYPPEMDPKPIHIGARTLLEGRPDAQLDAALRHPDVGTERALFCSQDDADDWDAWWSTVVEVWESNVRAAMRESREVELGTINPDIQTTAVTVRFVHFGGDE